MTAKNPRDHLIISMALGTGLRLAEIVGLNIGDVFTPDGTPKTRLRVHDPSSPKSDWERQRLLWKQVNRGVTSAD